MKKIMVITVLIVTASFASMQSFWDWSDAGGSSSRSQVPTEQEKKMVRVGCLEVYLSDLNSPNNNVAQTRTKELLKKSLRFSQEKRKK